jgi:hypothetical protein
VGEATICSVWPERRRRRGKFECLLAPVRFDHLFDLLETVARGDASDGYPPFDILKDGEDSYRIMRAVAGSRPEDIEAEARLARGDESSPDRRSEGQGSENSLMLKGLPAPHVRTGRPPVVLGAVMACRRGG